MPVTILALGFPSRWSAVEDFQRAWALGPALTVDGVVGPKTLDALRVSASRRAAGRPDASALFSFRQFACKCGRPACDRIWVRRELLLGLDRLAGAFYSGRLTPVSGCRCPARNRAVGGATVSQHLNGLAVDVPYAASWQHVAALGLFSGIGRSARTGLVRHVDMRHLLGKKNPTGGTPTHPTVWNYAA